MFAPVCRAQDIGVAVHISSSPAGIWFTVDGQNFQGSFSAVWPKGSKHVLSADAVVPAPDSKTQYTFKSWTTTGGHAADQQHGR